jgi:alkylhydroperoxidase family enzyme
VSEEQLRDLARFAESDAFDEAERLVLELCTTMSRTPADVPPELFEKLKARFSPEEIVELVTAISLENFRARFNRPFDVASENVSEGAFCPLPEHPDGA